MRKPLIGLISPSDEDARACAAAIERCEGQALRLDAAHASSAALAHALVLCDTPADAHGAEVRLLRAALAEDMPILAIGGGLHALNIALGGKPAVSLSEPLSGHLSPPAQAHAPDDEGGSAYHHIYIAPGSRLAAVVGSGGFVRVNSRHSLGLREARKAPQLLASAYSLEDGVIEALESPRHRWVIGTQFRPERALELPPHFQRLFQSLTERAAERMAGDSGG